MTAIEKQTARENAKESLKRNVKVSTTVFLVQVHSSADYSAYRVFYPAVEVKQIGMRIDPVVTLIDITELACSATGFRYDKRFKALGYGGNVNKGVQDVAQSI